MVLENVQLTYATLAAILLFYLVRRWLNPLYAIPTIGHSAPLLSYLSAVHNLRHAREMLQEGYDKFKGSAFRAPMLDRWVVMVCGTNMVEELRKMPEDQMSFHEAAEELVQAKYTVTAGIIHHPIHIAVIHGPLTRNLMAVTPDIVDEINVAIQELIPIKSDEWTSVPGLKTMIQIAELDILTPLGLPGYGISVGRNNEYLDVIMNYQKGVGIGRFILGLTPGFLKPIVGPLLPWSKNALKKFSVLTRPVVEQRQRELQDHGEAWNEKPNDALTWLIEEAKAVVVEKSTDLIVQALMTLNFVALHTSSNSLTHVLYHLAANPEYLAPLREEIERCVKADGWTKVAFANMRKLDSIMRESQRMNGISGVSVIRKAMKKVVLSDGTIIPEGTFVGSVSVGVHYDEEHYENPYTFKPFRFADMRDKEGGGTKYQYVNTSPEYVPFGHGKHACPGRFFAANLLKAVLAILIMNYDMKLEGGERPKNSWIGMSVLSHPTATVMLRDRQAQAP